MRNRCVCDDGPSVWLVGLWLGQLFVDDAFLDLEGGNDGTQGCTAVIVGDGGGFDYQPAGGAQECRSEPRADVLPLVGIFPNIA